MILNFKRSAAVILIFALAGFALLYKLGDVPLADPDEPRYAESAREMIERGSIMVPYFNYEPRINKPVLFYWTICASYLALGVSEFSARLPSALSAMAILLAGFVFVRRFCGFSAAACAALVMGSSPLFFVPGRLSMPDMLLADFIIVSLFAFYLGWNEPGGKRKAWWYFVFFFCQAGAAWIKGPVGIVIPLAVAAFSLWRARDLRELKRLRPAWSIPAVLLASLPWYLYIYLHVDRSAMATMSTSETVGRIFGTGGHDFDPIYFYFIIGLPGLLPWAFLLPWALRQRVRFTVPDRLRDFLETWFAVVFAFFSLCAIKKPQYIVMLSCVFASWFAIVAQRALPRRGRRDILLIASLFIFLAAAIVGSFNGLAWISKNQPELLAGGMALGCTLIVPSLAALWLASRGHARSAFAALSLVTFLSLVPVLHYGTAWMEKHRSMRAFLRENEAVISQAREVCAGVKIFNGLPFYLRRQVVMDTDEEYVLEMLRRDTPCVVFTSDKRYNHNKQDFERYLWTQNYGKVLLANFEPEGKKKK